MLSRGANIPRRQCIPILYTKGTHYDVGFDTVSFINAAKSEPQKCRKCGLDYSHSKNGIFDVVG